MSRVILISGKQGSGKTTLGHALVKELTAGGKFVVGLTFASTIYQIHDYAISLMQEKGMKFDLVKDGDLLQFLGTEWGRDRFGEDVWANCLKGDIKNYEEKFNDIPEGNLVFLVTDCRFKNELRAVPDAVTVRLECPREIRKERCEMWRFNDTHRSETDLDIASRDGVFDLKLHTDTETIDECVMQIVHEMEVRNAE